MSIEKSKGGVVYREGSTKMESKINPIFIAFHHTPFQKGEECEDDSENSRQILYLYPPKSDMEITKGLISLVVSLSTYANITLGGKPLEFISLQEKKISISTFEKSDKSQIVFILNMDPKFEDQFVCKQMKTLTEVIHFLLSKKTIEDNQKMKEFFLTEGPRIMDIIYPETHDGNASIIFPSITYAEKHQGILPTSLTELYLMNTDPRIWGICCFVDGSLLVSMTPISIIHLFLFTAPDTPQETVYLTRENRKQILEQENVVANIPDEDNIPATLIRYEDQKILFYVLTEANVEGDLLLKVIDTLKKSSPHISLIKKQRTKFPTGTIMYDKYMMMLRTSSQKDIDKKAEYIHTLFNEEREIHDALIRNSQEMTIAYNTFGVENYSTVQNSIKPTIEQAYDEAKRQSPQITRYIQNIKI